MFLPPKHVDSILNIGGGVTDQYEGILKRRCSRYANLDVRKSSKVDYVCDITRGTKFDDGEWEWGWASEVLEHIPQRKQKKFVKECARICKCVTFTFPTPIHPTFHDDPGHVEVIVDFSKYNIKDTTTKTGRRIVTIFNPEYIYRDETIDRWLKNGS